MSINAILGYAEKELNNIDTNSIDLIATDAPFEINYNSEKWDKKGLDWHLLFEQFFRILKPTGNLLLFQGWSNVCETIQIGNKFFTLKNWIIYDRIKGRGAKTNLVSTREDLLWFIKSTNYTYNKIASNIVKKTKGLGIKNGEPNRALSNVWTDIPPLVAWGNEKVDHPTQKPIAIMERIIKVWSNENDTVLDCFAGSGTTGIAAQNLNRNVILIEQEPYYYKYHICPRLQIADKYNCK